MESKNGKEVLTVSTLALVPVEELIVELMGRFDHAVFAGLRIKGKSASTIRRHRGNHHACAGLAADIARGTLNQLHDIEEPESAEEL